MILYSQDAEADRAFFREVLTSITLPGGGQLGLDEPRHQRATDR